MHHLVLIGDSNTLGSVCVDARRRIGPTLQGLLPDCMVSVYARNGASMGHVSVQPHPLWGAASPLMAGGAAALGASHAIVCFGAADWLCNVSLNEFAMRYVEFVFALAPAVVTLVAPAEPQPPYSQHVNEAGQRLSDYRQAVICVGAYLRLPVLDVAPAVAGAPGWRDFVHFPDAAMTAVGTYYANKQEVWRR